MVSVHRQRRLPAADGRRTCALPFQTDESRHLAFHRHARHHPEHLLLHHLRKYRERSGRLVPRTARHVYLHAAHHHGIADRHPVGHAHHHTALHLFLFGSHHLHRRRKAVSLHAHSDAHLHRSPHRPERHHHPLPPPRTGKDSDC